MDSRAKGYRFENLCCRILTALYAPMIDPTGPLETLPFRRRSVSIMPLVGHWRGSGDILWRPENDLPFVVECKSCEGWELDGAFYAEKWPPLLWWKQAAEQAERQKRTTGQQARPLLFFTRNLRPVYCMASMPDVAALLGGRVGVPDRKQSWCPARSPA